MATASSIKKQFIKICEKVFNKLAETDLQSEDIGYDDDDNPVISFNPTSHQEVFFNKEYDETMCLKIAKDIVYLNIDSEYEDDLLENPSSLSAQKKYLKDNSENSTEIFKVYEFTYNELKKMWDGFNPQEKTMKKKGATVKERIVNTGKVAVKKTLIRKATRKLVQQSSVTLAGILEAHPTLKALVPYIQTPAGQAGVTLALAMGLEFLPLPEAIKEQFDTIKDSLVEELSIMSVDQATIPLEQVAGLLLPALQSAIIPLLTANKELLQLKA